MSQLDNRIHPDFLWIYRARPEKFKSLNSSSKKLRNLCEMCSIFEIILRKKGFLARIKLDIFEKWIHFLILSIFSKNYTLLQSGVLRPRTPCGGRVIASKWPGLPRPPPKHPGDPTAYK